MAKVKKGVFFIIDAILASSIIIAVLLLIHSYYINEAPTTTINYFAQDLSRVLSTITVGETNNSYIRELIDSGTIDKLNNTILEQIGEFWAENKTILAQNIFRNVTNNLIPNTFGFGVWVNNDLLYEKNSLSNKKDSLISYRRIISGIAKDKPTESFSSKVIFSGSTTKTILAYAYFGGFVGDGVISQYIVLPDNYTSVNEAYMEFAVSSDFDLEINGINSGTYPNKETNELMADKYNISSIYYTNFIAGLNKIKITFLNASKFIGGGFFKVSVNSTDISYIPYTYDTTNNIVTKKFYLSGVDGVINIYSSFYVPGDLNLIEMSLNYSTNFPLFVNFGNVTVYNGSSTGIVNVVVSNSTISNVFNSDYSSLSRKTVPLRIGHFTTDKVGDFARRTDTFIATDVSTSMDIEDVPDAPGQSRLDVAKTVEKNFVDFVFNKSLQNRLGLVTYHSSVEPGQSLDLTNNNVTLKNKIDGYQTKSVNTCFSCAIKFAQDKIVAQGDPAKKWSIILMSDGTADKCDAIPQSKCTQEAAKNESIQYACDAYQNYNISIYAIGFGAGADNTTLKNISEDCSDGLFFSSNNQSGLQQAFDQIAEDLLSLTFEYQKTVAEGVVSALSEISYIELKYTPDIPPLIFGKIPITVEDPPFGNSITNGIINIPPNVDVIEGLVTSYSSDKWTESVNVNGNEVFDLSDYNKSYIEIGDPFLVNIPATLLQGGSNTIDIRTASGPFPQNESGGSPDDRAIYTILIENAVSYASVSAKAEGCTWWSIKFEDGTNITIQVPVAYNGSKICEYENAIYDRDDAIDNAMYLLLSQLDLDKDGLLDVNIDERSLFVDSFVITEVPSLWGPAILEVRVWQ